MLTSLEHQLRLSYIYLLPVFMLINDHKLYFTSMDIIQSSEVFINKFNQSNVPVAVSFWPPSLVPVMCHLFVGFKGWVYILVNLCQVRSSPTALFWLNFRLVDWGEWWCIPKFPIKIATCPEFPEGRFLSTHESCVSRQFLQPSAFIVYL